MYNSGTPVISAPKTVAVVSPCMKKPLLTMDMFKPYVAEDQVDWRKEYNVSDAECQDPYTWGTDEDGNAMKHTDDPSDWPSDNCVRVKKIPLVYKAKVDHNKLVTDKSYDARSERAARRTATKTTGFARTLRYTPSVIS